MNNERIFSRDEGFMRHAIRLARMALDGGDTPVGSVVVYGDRIIGEGIESVRRESDITAHAEVRAVQHACRARGSRNLTGCALYTTVEPCWMCSYIIRSVRISRVITGKAVPHAGGISSMYPVLTDPSIPTWNSPPEITTGVLEEECSAVFSQWPGGERQGSE